MLRSGFRENRNEETSTRYGGRDLARAPHGAHRGAGNQTDDGVRPPQPFMKPVLPVLAQPDAVTAIAIEKYLMSVADQPIPNSINNCEIAAGVADEDPGHNTSFDAVSWLIDGLRALRSTRWGALQPACYSDPSSPRPHPASRVVAG